MATAPRGLPRRAPRDLRQRPARGMAAGGKPTLSHTSHRQTCVLSTSTHTHAQRTARAERCCWRRRQVLRPHLPAEHNGARLVDLNERCRGLKDSSALCPLPAARCPLPAARCPLPSARCPLPLLCSSSPLPYQQTQRFPDRSVFHRCRFLCYTPGQAFEPHCDGRYTRPPVPPHQHARAQTCPLALLAEHAEHAYGWGWGGVGRGTHVRRTFRRSRSSSTCTTCQRPTAVRRITTLVAFPDPLLDTTHTQLHNAAQSKATQRSIHTLPRCASPASPHSSQGAREQGRVTGRACGGREPAPPQLTRRAASSTRAAFSGKVK